MSLWGISRVNGPLRVRALISATFKLKLSLLGGPKPCPLLGVAAHCSGQIPDISIATTPDPDWLISVSVLSCLGLGGYSSATERRRRSRRRWGRSAAISRLLLRSSRPSRRKTRGSLRSSRYWLDDFQIGSVWQMCGWLLNWWMLRMCHKEEFNETYSCNVDYLSRKQRYI